jgi:serine/threonine protein kinase
MSDDSPTAGWALPPSRAQDIDQICDAFEAAWQAGQRPPIQAYLASSPESARPALLRELLTLELAYRGRAGEKPTPEDYREQFPGQAELVRAVFAQAETGYLEDAVTNTLGQRPLDLDRQRQLGGRYELLGELSRGGMGVVYRARHLMLNLPVALKMIRAGHFASQEEVDRFLREAAVIARLSHPHVVRIYDCGEDQGLPFFSMELMGGGTLAQKLAGSPLPSAEAAGLVEVLARTMHFVHEQDIIHRDLKPANVLFTARGVVKIADFGLVKRLDAETACTRTGAILGTASYMAPEQAAGRTKEIGPCTDVFALGAILYESLTGRPPFRAETRELTLHQVLFEEPAWPTRLRPELPSDLEAICLKCLEKEPGRRYATALDLAEDLRRFRDGEPISIATIDEWERQVRWGRRAGYEILELLGAGVLGMVYRARQLRLNRIVTLKTISSRAQTDPAKMTRFRAEAESAAQLQHPGIRQIYDFHEQNGQPYFSMEFMAGGSLAEKCAGRLLPAREAVECLEPLARAMHYAHQRGMIHGSLRSSKVLLTETGVPKITGFGLAQLLQKQPLAVGLKGAPLGLSNYMAPEQSDGRIEDIGPATDVYALGAILYEMLTGRPPVLADTVRETVEQILTREPEPPTRLRPEMPRDLEAICLKCLRKDPRQRYASAEALAEDLRRFREGKTLAPEATPG